MLEETNRLIRFYPFCKKARWMSIVFLIGLIISLYYETSHFQIELSDLGVHNGSISLLMLLSIVISFSLGELPKVFETDELYISTYNFRILITLIMSILGFIYILFKYLGVIN